MLAVVVFGDVDDVKSEVVSSDSNVVVVVVVVVVVAEVIEDVRACDVVDDVKSYFLFSLVVAATVDASVVGATDHGADVEGS